MRLQNASITILVNKDSIDIKITDDIANTTFAEATLTPEQFCNALSRLSNVGCIVDVYGIEHIGKKHENKSFEFEIPKEVYDDWKHRETRAFETAKQECPEGWTPDSYFGSRDSFFKKDDKYFAVCTIRRWV